MALSNVSLARLQTCDPRLQEIVVAVSKEFPITVICGHRSEAEQNKAVAEGKSQTPFPQSKHNSFPSMAVDIAPIEFVTGKPIIDWKDAARFYYLAGHMMREAINRGVPLRFGGDWDKDTELKDNKFNDLPHFEIVEV